MTFAELRSTLDKGIHAFADWESVADAKEIGHIPEQFHDLVPDKCECGSEMIVTLNQKQIQCCDPYCYIKAGIALSEMITSFQIKNFGDASGIKIYKEFKATSDARKEKNAKELPRLQSIVAEQEEKLAQQEARKLELEQDPVVQANLEHFNTRIQGFKFRAEMERKLEDLKQTNQDTEYVMDVLYRLTGIINQSDIEHRKLIESSNECKEYAELLDKIDNLTGFLEQNRRSISKIENREGVMVTDSFMEIFRFSFDQYPASIQGTVKGLELFEAGRKICSTELTYPQMIQHLGIPHVDSKALVLFRGLNNYKEYQASVEKCGGLSNFCSSRGIYAPMVTFSLKTAVRDILMAEHLMGNHLRPEGIMIQKVCTTGRFTFRGDRVTKGEFIAACNRLMRTEDGIQLLEVVEDKSFYTTDYIIYSVPSGDRHYLIGKDRGVLITTDDFYAMLERRKEAWLKEIELANCCNQTEEMNSF